MNAVSSAQTVAVLAVPTCRRFGVAVLACRRFGHNAVGTWRVHAPSEDKTHFRNKTCTCKRVSVFQAVYTDC